MKTNDVTCKKSRSKLWVLIALAGLVVVGVGGYLGMAKGSIADAQTQERSARKGGSLKRADVKKAVKRALRRPKIKRVDVRRQKAVVRNKPQVDAGEQELTQLEKSILAEIRAALDVEDLKGVRKAIAKFYLPASAGGLDGNVPKELRMEALEALAWFRPATAVDMLTFMTDNDEDVVDDAFTKFELELDESSLGDKARSEILVQVMKAMEDSDRIDTLLMNLNNMRNSVKASTAQQILDSGSAKAKSVMRENLEFYFESDVQDTVTLTKWVQENPDDADDESTYGPQKNDDATAGAASEGGAQAAESAGETE